MTLRNTLRALSLDTSYTAAELARYLGVGVAAVYAHLTELTARKFVTSKGTVRQGKRGREARLFKMTTLGWKTVDRWT